MKIIRFNSVKTLLFAAMAIALCSQSLTVRAATVQNLNDSGPGSLRAAIAAASPGEIISFGALTGTIFLSSGELPINQNLNINGPGAKSLTIGANTSRVFNIAPAANVSISGLTLQGNTQGNPAMGGGVLNAGQLTLNQCHISGCSAVGQPGKGFGGGIYSSGGLAMTACTVSYCRAAGSDDPTVAYPAYGGGLYVLGSMALTNCTLTWNKAVGSLPDGPAQGGAIDCHVATGQLAMVNCTISGNQVGDYGNYSDANGAAGIDTSFSRSLWMINCIVLGNYKVCCSEEIRSRETTMEGLFTSGGHNLLYTGDPEGGAGYINNANGTIDFLYSSADALRLGWPLQDHGGPTPTLSIGKAGAAYDVGNDSVLAYLSTDQRGLPRLADTHVDAGAYELQFGFPCLACTIYWNLQASGRWDFQSNWNGALPGGGYSAFITNATSKTITIDSFTSSNAMSISNLWVSAPSNSVNTLLLNAGPTTPFRIHDNFFVLGGGALIVSNSTIRMNSGTPSTNAFANGSSVIFDGPATFTSASLDATNAFDLTIGNSSAGSLTMNNSTLKAYDMFVGSGANGIVSLNNTVTVLNRSLFIGTSTGKTATFNIAGGTFIATNSISTNAPSLVFERGIGQMTISSNATVQFGSALLGSFLGSASLTLQSGNLSFSGPLQLENGALNLKGGTLTLANDLTLAARSNSVAQFNLSGGGTLSATNGTILVGSGGSGQMTVSNATVIAQQIKLGGTTVVASGIFRMFFGAVVKILGNACSACGLSTNDAEVDGGDLDASGAAITVGDGHDALFTVTGGTVEAGALNVGSASGFTGTFNQSGGAVTIGTNGFTVGYFGSTGIVTMTGGSFTNISSLSVIGRAGLGQMTLSGGTLLTSGFTVGSSALSQGTLTVAGGTWNTLPGAGLAIGANSLVATGAVSVVGGAFSPGSIVVGNLGVGQLTVSGGVTLVQNYLGTGITIGKLASSRGTYAQSVGVVSTPAFTVGRATCDSTGTATLNSGTLLVTNSTHDAALTVQGGTFTLNGGTLMVDKLILTNSCGHFVKNGGTLIYTSLVLDPNQDADGDGLSNGYEQTHGLDPLSPTTMFIVTNNNDSGAGSLRQAIANANFSTNTVITFAPNVTGTITLTSGELLVSLVPVASNSVAIIGPGANVLTVSGNSASRVFSVTSGIVSISGLTLADGLGGIYMHDAALSINDCVISGHNGSGIYNGTNGALTLNNCTISSNRFVGPNFVDIQGGGILNASSNAVLWMANCTISGNALVAHTTSSIGASGGGLFNNQGTVTIQSCTISGNLCTNYGGGKAFGGGLYNAFGSGIVVVGNSIIASNTLAAPGGATSGPDCRGAFFSEGYNLIGITNINTTGWGATGDQMGTAAVPLNPLLGPLQNNGGTTPTHALLAGSPALDKGNSFGLLTDQRGSARPSDNPLLSNATGGDGSDIGAYEVRVGFNLVTSVVGGGVILRNPNLTTFPTNSSVVLSVLPASGWTFDHWSGDASGANNSLNVLMTSDKFITANFSALTSPCDVTPSGLISWWPAGTNANDVVGTNNGTLQNGATFTAGEAGLAFGFDGVNDYVQVPGFLSVGPDKEVTVEFWQKVSSLKVQSTFSASAFVIGSVFNAHVPYSDGKVYWDFGDISAGGRLSYTPPASITGTWQHFALVASQSGNYMRIYRNGVLEAEKAGMTPFVRTNLDLDIGGAASLGISFGGQIDELAIYNRALGLAEIQTIYNAGSMGKCLTPVYITSVSKSGNNLNLSWLAQQGLTYRVQYQTNLNPSALWIDVSGDVTATGNSASKTDILPANAPQRFYRVMMFR